MEKKKILVSAPGRLCLLGEHQDYFGLPIIAAAINLRIYITGIRTDEKHIKLALPDIGEKDEFPVGKELPYSQERDYLKSAVNILLRKKILPESGWKARVRGSIPINSGTASSSALVVAWIGFLLKASGDTRASSPKEIAELAFGEFIRSLEAGNTPLEAIAEVLDNFLPEETMFPSPYRD